LTRRALRRLLVVATVAGSLVPFAAKPAWACSCTTNTPAERAGRADAVFTGTVARITDGVRDRVVNFDVDTVYKGEANPSIDVHTALQGATCGVHFVLNRRYTVFAFQSKGEFSANSCEAPVGGNIDPSSLGLGPGTTGFQQPVTGLHRPLSRWLIVFTLVAVAGLVLAIAVVARRRRAAERVPSPGS
jgi:hypothetical protein